MMLFQHPYYQIHLVADGNVLLFQWQDTHATMNYEDFLEACSNYAGYASEHRCDALLIDTRNFVYQPPAAFRDWQNQVHHLRLERIGIQKMAYLMPPEVVPQLTEQPSATEGIARKYFDTESIALAWLSAA